MLLQLRTNPTYLRAVIATIVAEALLIALLRVPFGTKPLLEFDPKTSLALFTGIPLFLITIIQLHASSVVQRANYIKDFAVTFHQEKAFSDAFYYLVYSYTNEMYARFIAADSKAQGAMQGARTKGQKLYNPKTFIGSAEERRLDALLGFFDVIGYHHYKGIVHMRDVAGVFGFQLAALATRQVIKDYRAAIPEHWPTSSFAKDFNTVAPFRYLEELLKAFQAHCIQHEKEIAELNQNYYRAIEQKKVSIIK
jgi:hypothetical protein